MWETYKNSIFICQQGVAIQTCFAIISAQNPAGKLLNDNINLCLDKRFKSQAVQYGQQLEQNAIYWVEHNKLFLVPVLYQHAEEYLGLFQSRVVLMAD